VVIVEITISDPGRDFLRVSTSDTDALTSPTLAA
jgi:hypothetical protein